MITTAQDAAKAVIAYLKSIDDTRDLSVEQVQPDHNKNEMDRSSRNTSTCCEAAKKAVVRLLIFSGRTGRSPFSRNGRLGRR
jgi:hypothetical protein